MKESVLAALQPVKGRQQLAFLTRATAYGLLAGSVVGVGLGVGRLLLGWPVAWPVAAGVLAAGPLLGLLVGVTLRRSYRQAAAAVDAHYQLKDRSVTALEFLTKADVHELHQLQIADALDHLQRVEPKQVVPIKAPKALPAGVAAGVLAAFALFWPLNVSQVEAKTAPAPENVVAEADRILDSLTNLEEMANEEENAALKELVTDLKKKAEEMKQDGVDEREALAKLSEMQAAIQAQLAQYNQAVMDGQLSSLGNALAAAQAFEGAGKALQEAKLDRAAEEFARMEDPDLTPKEAKALEEKLKDLAKQMGDVGLGALSNAVGELGENTKGGKGTGKAAKKLGKAVEKESRRRKVAQLLQDELENLKEGKCNCQNNSLVKGKKPEKSKTGSTNWGMSTSGNGLGEKTRLASQRQQMELTGTPGDEGESEVESTTSPEARQQASRSYKERYQKYRKESDAVLEGEAIPLGQRQMIRKYFESIRPQGVEPGEGNQK